MFKRILFAAAILMFCSPAFVAAQDIFFSFDEFSRVSTATVDSDVTDTGSVFIFADENFDFNQIDVEFTTSSPGVAAFTGGQTFNSDGSFTLLDIAGPPSDPSLGLTPTDGRLFGVSFLTPGIVPGNTSDPDYRAGADGFLLAQLDYAIGGGGTANFDFSLGINGVVNDGVGQVATTFGSAELTALGEPAPFVPPVDPPVVPPVVPPEEPPVSGNPDFFLSFDENSRLTDANFGADAATASLFIFADSSVDFNQLDLDFSIGNNDVLSISEVTTFNSEGNFTIFDALDPDDSTAGPTTTDARLVALSFLTDGISPENTDSSDFRSGADGFLLARVDFDIVGIGDVDFDLILGELGVINDGVGSIGSASGGPTFGSAAFNNQRSTAIPEPSSAVLLILGAAGMFARRRRP